METAYAYCYSCQCGTCACVLSVYILLEHMPQLISWPRKLLPRSCTGCLARLVNTCKKPNTESTASKTILDEYLLVNLAA